MVPMNALGRVRPDCAGQHGENAIGDQREALDAVRPTDRHAPMCSAGRPPRWQGWWTWVARALWSGARLLNAPAHDYALVKQAELEVHRLGPAEPRRTTGGWQFHGSFCIAC